MKINWASPVQRGECNIARHIRYAIERERYN